MRNAPAASTLLSLALIALAAPGARAQTPGRPYVLKCERKEVAGDRYRCQGQVEFEQDDVKIYADTLEFFDKEDRAIASGNVVLSQAGHQIAADRADFNTRTRLGTFYTATGVATIPPQPQAPPVPGMFVPPRMAGQDTEVYFFGEVVEKVGTRRYIISNGGFTTCVQPTPRWDLHAGRISLNLDDHAFLRNSIFSVKGLPVLYLPVAYYPMNESGRSTGFLLPTWGTSTALGQSIGNQFFWAIDRSQDATFMYDWFSKFGQGAGAEYRYNLGTGAGGATAYLLDARGAPTAGSLLAESSFKIVGAAHQTLPHRLRASADANYFTSIGTNQIFMTNIADASRSTRSYGGNLAGSRGAYSASGTFRRNEWFNDLNTSSLTGTSPLLALTRGERPLAGRSSPLYASFTSEYARIDRETRSSGATTDNRSLTRLDLSPKVRYPFKRWPWLTATSTLGWRDTFYSKSQHPVSKAVLDDNLNRAFFTARSELVGPVLNRVWDTPASAYAEKFKHTIEPSFSVERTTAIDDFARVVEGIDSGVVGGVTTYAYGVTNRVYAKRRLGPVSPSQEILNVGVRQSYYTDARAAQFDATYGTSFTGASPTRFSPIQVTANASPAAGTTATLRAEIDPTRLELRTLSAGASRGWPGGVASLSWNQTFFVPGLPGFTREQRTRSLNSTTNLHTVSNRYGATYVLAVDALRSTILQQTVQSYYNAQCCGIAFQYSRAHLAAIPNNNRWLVSFTLAGLGSFSPFDGGLNGVPR